MFSNKLAITWLLFGDSGDYLANERAGLLHEMYELIALSDGDEQFKGITKTTGLIKDISVFFRKYIRYYNRLSAFICVHLRLIDLLNRVNFCQTGGT